MPVMIDCGKPTTEFKSLSKELRELRGKDSFQCFKGKKLLEIGSGATVHNIACASAYFPIIVQSDFVKDNREALKRWLKKDSPLDWSEFLNIPARMEDFQKICGGGSLVAKVTDSWQACHDFEPSTAEDLPCKGEMHVKSVESSNALPLVWRVAAQVSSSSLDHGSKLQAPFPKAFV
ncbi:hypothetical protein TNCV_1858891 [Trichonephila clavipes]|nr:hypothetical protein TNCV_1858891 [Trichonephila clavipes]